MPNEVVYSDTPSALKRVGNVFFKEEMCCCKTFMIIYLGSNPPGMIPSSGMPQAKTM